MGKNRLEAFSDGVIAVIITIMVLALKTPHSADFEALRELFPTFLSYVLSYIYIGIYWNNHHHLFQAAQRISGMTLWANLHLLFWLSLIPFITGWMSSTDFSTAPVIAYGVILFMSAVAWDILRQCLVKQHDHKSIIVRALSRHVKEWVSAALYAAGIGAAFFNTTIACILYAVVACMWFVPDRRIERQIHN